MNPSSTEPSTFQKRFLDFDIDNYLNYVVPRQRFHLLPTAVSFWFGYRAPGSKPQPRLPNVGVWLSAFLGGFIGIAIISNVYKALPLLGGQQAPIVIASFGAAAILEYHTIESPLSQPRNLIVGHFLAAVVGVAVTKGFERLPAERFEDLRWLAGSVAVGLASAVMGATKTIHPPAGATALLASTTPEITVLGWWVLPLVLLGATLMCASALIVNNITRQWPLHWWTPADLTKKKIRDEYAEDVERQDNSDSGTARADSDTSSTAKWNSRHIEEDEISSKTLTNDENRHEVEDGAIACIDECKITITASRIVLPDSWDMDDRERELLDKLRNKLRALSTASTR